MAKKSDQPVEPKTEMPTNVPAEQAVLGACLRDNNQFLRVNNILDAEQFSEGFHAHLYDVIGKVIAGGSTANPVTLKGLVSDPEGLKIDGQDATALQYMIRLVSEAPAANTARDYALVVHDKWIARQVISELQTGIETFKNLAPGQRPVSAFDPVEERIAAIRAKDVSSPSNKGAGDSYIDSLERAQKRGEVDGVPIVLKEIATVISEPCFEAGNLYGLLSSSGEGKTALTVQQMHHALRHGHPVLLLSYDQSNDQIVRQMVSQQEEVSASRQRNPKLLSPNEFDRCKNFARWLNSQPFEVARCTDEGAAKLVGMARSFIKRRGNGKCPLIVVDHIGAVSPEDSRASEGQKAKQIGQVFKSGAVATNAAWMVLQQRNSGGIRRDNPRPVSGDLYGGEPAKAPFDAIWYLLRWLVHYQNKKDTVASSSDEKRIEKVFPAAVRLDGADIAEIGALKVRFGSAFYKQDVKFEANFTRYRAEQEPAVQHELIESFL